MTASILRTSNTNEGTDLCLTSITGACWMVSCTGCGEWYHEECVPIPKQVWRKTQNMSDIVTTADYIIVYNFLIIQDLKNVKGCRDGMPKSMQTR